MEADRLRENPQTPHQQETLQAITQGCTRLMRLLLAANNQATRRRKHKKLPSTSFNWVQAATDMHPACPNKKQNHLQNNLLRRTQFWVRKSFSKPASLKRASLVAIAFASADRSDSEPSTCPRTVTPGYSEVGLLPWDTWKTWKTAE